MNDTVKNNRGFSLVETLVYVALLSSMSMIFMAITADIMKNAGFVLRAKDAQQNSRFILSRISQEIKTAKSVAGVSADKLTILNKDNETVFFEYDSVNKTVVYNNGTENLIISGPDVSVNRLYFSEIAGLMVRTEIDLEKAGLGSWGGAYEIKDSVLAQPRPMMY